MGRVSLLAPASVRRETRQNTMTEPLVQMQGVSKRFLAVQNIPELFRFANDMLPVDAEPNRLNDQVLVRYYEHEWKDIAH